jgi:NAD(P)-dependent dehydrogenase (short-subunit alcohol dehydrogenase family)
MSVMPPAPIRKFMPDITQAVNLNSDDIKEGKTYSYRYCPVVDALYVLLERFDLQSCSLECLVSILAWSSYSVGMVVPGQQAFYSQIKLNMDKSAAQLELPLQCIVRIDKFHIKYNLLSMGFECLSANGTKISYGILNAFIRKEINILASDISFISKENRKKLSGKTALITGASRGLGAVIARLLAAMSCRIIVNFEHSLSDALLLQDEIIRNGGAIELWQGDISDIDWLGKKRKELLDRGVSLDILICNACQPPQALFLESSAISRINTYISKNIELTSVPLSFFAPIINDQCGYGIIISSEYVIDPPKEFPHYVSVKTAVEGLVQSVALKYHNAKWIIVRPPRMLTDMSNSPVDNRGLVDPVLIGKSICEYLITDDKIDDLHSVKIFVPEV